jgi:hypothetical protein
MDYWSKVIEIIGNKASDILEEAKENPNSLIENIVDIVDRPLTAIVSAIVDCDKSEASLLPPDVAHTVHLQASAIKTLTAKTEVQLNQVLGKRSLKELLPEDIRVIQEKPMIPGRFHAISVQIAGRPLTMAVIGEYVNHSAVRITWSDGYEEMKVFYEWEKKNADDSLLEDVVAKLTILEVKDNDSFGEGEQWTNWSPPELCSQVISRTELESWMKEEEQVRKYLFHATPADRHVYNCRTFAQAVLSKVGGTAEQIREVGVFH